VGMNKGNLKGINEILTILSEECAEVIQASSKVQRFGEDENLNELEKELGDLLAMIMLITEKDIVSQNRVWDGMGNKLEKLKKWSNIKGLDAVIKKFD
jgi:phosphoribosyl-ATP pyrophosphohydrolase